MLFLLGPDAVSDIFRLIELRMSLVVVFGLFFARAQSHALSLPLLVSTAIHIDS